MEGPVLIALAAAASGLVSAGLSYFGSRHRDSGQFTLSDRAAFTQEQVEFRRELRDEVERLRAQVEALGTENTRMRHILDQLEDEIDAYRVTLREAGIVVPVRRPYYRYPNDAERGPNDPRGPDNARAPNDLREAQDPRRPNDMRWMDDERRPNDRRRPDDEQRPGDVELESSK